MAERVTGRRAVFLDRDGTVIEDADYLDDPGDIALIEGAEESLRRLRSAGWTLVVVTNQSGIARGRFSVQRYHEVAAALGRRLLGAGCEIDATCFCPHHPDHSGPCGCRKPKPGMLMAAAAALGIDLSRSFMVGDKVSDVQAGLAAGCAPILVRTGYGRRAEAEADLPPGTPVVDSIVEATGLILAAEAR